MGSGSKFADVQWSCDSGSFACPQLAEEMQRLQASASDRTEELAARIAARQRWLAEEQAAVDRKIQEATQPVAAQQAQHAAALQALQAEVAALRWALSGHPEKLTAPAVQPRRAHSQQRVDGPL